MRHFLCAVVFVMCNLAVFAQDAPKAEIFAGFSYANYELIPPIQVISFPNGTSSGSPSARMSLFGWNGSVAVNVNRWFSLATDFSGYYSGSSITTTETISCGTGCTQTTTNVASSPKIHNFLFGPAVFLSCRKNQAIRPFSFGRRTSGCDAIHDHNRFGRRLHRKRH